MEYHVMIFYDWENDKSNIDWLYKYIAYPSQLYRDVTIADKGL